MKRASILKISRPVIPGILSRKRLFKLLDDSLKKPVVWVSSSAGSGKTTLISSYLESRKLHNIWYQCDEDDADLAAFFYYMGLAAKKAAPRYKKPLPLLTPEYLANVPTFTRRYFEEIFSRLAPPRSRSSSKGGKGWVIVLDNCQDALSGPAFNDMIANGLDIIPDGVHVVVISRGAPPPALARLQANEKISVIGHDDLRFTAEESKELVHARLPKLDKTRIQAIYEKAEGWAAGITLMLERARLGGTGAESAEGIGHDVLFDYFAGEVFGKTEKDVQDFLLKTAFLPMPSVPLAEKLTGVGNAGRILAALNRQHYFTERLSGSGQDYQYHPLFREFLLNRAKTAFSPDELAVIHREAALLLEQSGQLENAARIYSDAGDRQGLARMIISHARELLAQGRNKTLEEWIAGLSGEPVDDNPWLLYWIGMCSFPIDMERARKYLEEAFESFKAKDDVTGVYLSWAGIVDTYAYGFDEWKRLDDWIAVLDGIRKAYPSLPSKEIDLIVSSRMLFSLTLRKTDQPQWVHGWLERVSTLLDENPSFAIEMDTVFSMSVYYLWTGEYNKNYVLLEKMDAEIRHRKPSSFAVIRMKLMKGIHYWVTAQYESALDTLSEGLNLSDKSGVHALDPLLWSFMAAAQMARGNMELAEKSLNNQRTSLMGRGKTLDMFFYHINSAWYAILKRNPSLAAENMEMISAKVEKMGTPYYRALWNIGMAQVSFLQGRAKEAKTHINTAYQVSVDMKSHVLEWYSLLISAYFLLKEGKEREGLLSLRKGLSLGNEYGYVHLEFYQPSVMRFLYAKALEEGIEREYVKGLIRKLDLTPPSPRFDKDGGGSEVENWPYPIKIYTLGRFEIFINEKPMVFSKKVPKKPLALLKALIAFGGIDVAVNKITDALWPDADGDAASSSFKVNLHHLRKLLGREESVLTSERRISLNFQYCYVDVSAFAHIASAIMGSGAEAGKAEMKKLIPLAEKALEIYKGNFIEDDEGYPYIAVLRERLRSKFVHLVEMTGMYYEKQKQCHKAVELYEKGIETDEFQEEFYKRLMLCYRELGKYKEAVSAYNRCHRMLHIHFGVEPSIATKAVYEKLITP